MPEPEIVPLFNSAEVELLQDAVAGWLAHYLMRAEMMDGSPARSLDFEIMTEAGRKLGMEL